jgi:hypothetical protein
MDFEERPNKLDAQPSAYWQDSAEVPAERPPMFESIPDDKELHDYFSQLEISGDSRDVLCLPAKRTANSSAGSCSELECVICCSPIERQTSTTALVCMHVFHTDCISDWLEKKKECPICREEV